MSDMKDTPPLDAHEDAPLPHLRFLKTLVTVLAGTMIIGLITIVALLVIRFPTAINSGPSIPPEIVLPIGVTAEAYTVGRGWYAIVTTQNEILIFDAKTKLLRQTVKISTEQ
jgi:hypothetical protein